MSTELIAIISIGVAIIGLVITVVGLLLTIEHRLRKEMQAQRAENQAEFKTQRAENQAEFKAQRAEIQSLRSETQAEFKAVREITTNLLERMARVEGLLEGLRESFTGRRIEAVAEDPEEYDPRGAGEESKLTGSE